MKYKLFYVTPLVVSSMFSTLLATTPLSSAKFSFIENSVKVADVSHAVLRARAGLQERPAQLNQVVTSTEAVVTRTKSRAELVFNDGTVTRLGANTFFTFDPKSRDITLSSGTALFNVPKGRGRTNIHTAGATAAITGTTLVVQALPNGQVNIYVYEGTVEVDGEEINGGQVLIIQDGKSQKSKFDKQKAMQKISLFTSFSGLPSQGAILTAIEGFLEDTSNPLDPEERSVLEEVVAKLEDNEVIVIDNTQEEEPMSYGT